VLNIDGAYTDRDAIIDSIEWMAKLMLDFKDLVVVVTGGASGIGRSLAHAFARAGAKLIIADIKQVPVDTVVGDIKARGGEATAVCVDLSLRDDVARLAKITIERYGRINMLCNIAGVQALSKLHETKWADIEWIFSVNVFALCHTVHFFMPHLLAAAARGERAHVVNTASGFGLAVPPLGPTLPTAYTGSKHAVVGLSDAMRVDLKDTGVSVSVVCPGVVNTQTWTSTSFRPVRFGGPAPGSPQSKAVIEAVGQDPDETASMILEGLHCGDFYILPYTEESSASMKQAIAKRYEELMAAIS
jgi:NAD(P)-dependent dehydrogenase (short-subunit alcohol dehydrogenase family)